MRFAGAVTVALLGCLPAAAPVLAATDVSQLLAPAPAADWVAREPSAADLVGPITAKSYSTWTNDTTSERALQKDGFITGYGLAWEQKVTQDYLAEFVLEFRTPDGATSWYNGLKLYDQTSKYYQKDIPTVSTAHSVGVEWKFSDGSREFAIEFAKGNLFFDVTMDADTNDLGATTKAQAQTMFDGAPDMVSVAATNPLPGVSGTAIGLALIALCGLVAGVILVLIRTSRRPALAPAVAGGGLQMSPDGAYWWDGVQWRNAAADIPPTAQRSPDGHYWWDGRTWRRTGS